MRAGPLREGWTEEQIAELLSFATTVHGGSASDTLTVTMPAAKSPNS